MESGTMLQGESNGRNKKNSMVQGWMQLKLFFVWLAIKAKCKK
jgi:hypothetical protein